MKESTKNEKVNVSEKGEERVIKEVKKTYSAPNYESHNPLEIMSAWQDNSSELTF